MSEVEIQVEGTPNPNAAKFTLSRSLPTDESRSYFDADAAAGDPLARRLFDVEGVRALLMVDNFITVTKAEEARWDDLVPPIREAIRRALA
ncbi:MAG TPA: NifU N-terminal domain-containing protein [Gemmatimonadota bacterium]|nr:NifU N-terminal domain-containing protein [Gemmatimonadota bacterium]